MSGLRESWELGLGIYKFIAYWTPAGWLMVRHHEKSASMDGAPWWLSALAAVCAVLAWACTFRLDQEKPRNS